VIPTRVFPLLFYWSFPPASFFFPRLRFVIFSILRRAETSELWGIFFESSRHSKLTFWATNFDACLTFEGVLFFHPLLKSPTTYGSVSLWSFLFFWKSLLFWRLRVRFSPFGRERWRQNLAAVGLRRFRRQFPLSLILTFELLGITSPRSLSLFLSRTGNHTWYSSGGLSTTPKKKISLSSHLAILSTHACVMVVSPRPGAVGFYPRSSGLV